ncbi:MAG: hypothetical protein ACXW3V_06565, partial [Methylocystis sp.]
MARGISTILTAVIFGAIGFGLGIYAAPTEGVANLKAAIEGRFKPAPAEDAAPAETPATPAESDATAQPDASAAPAPETPPAEQPAAVEAPMESAP